jgi:hypothetical protein
MCRINQPIINKGRKLNRKNEFKIKKEVENKYRNISLIHHILLVMRFTSYKQELPDNI